jgi:chromosome condensin MukBEF complex kleisin-like MukF subunit
MKPINNTETLFPAGNEAVQDRDEKTLRMQDFSERMEYHKAAAANDRYNKDLQKYLQGRLNRHAVFDLGESSGALSPHLNGKRLFMRQGIVAQAVKYGVKAEDLRDLPLKLHQAERDILDCIRP